MITSIEIRGLAALKSVSVSPLGAGIIGFSGPYGSGKTTLLEAMGPLLLARQSVARSSHRKTPLSKLMSKDGSIRLAAVDTDGAKWTFDHTTTHAIVKKDGSTLCRTAKEFTSLAARQFPPLDFFLATQYTDQNKRGQFDRLQKKDRQGLWRGLLDLDRFVDVHGAARSERKSAEQALGNANAANLSRRNGVEDIDQIREQIETAIRVQAGCKIDVDTLAAERKSLVAAGQKYADTLRFRQVVVAELATVQRELDRLEASRKILSTAPCGGVGEFEACPLLQSSLVAARKVSETRVMLLAKLGSLADLDALVIAGSEPEKSRVAAEKQVHIKLAQRNEQRDAAKVKVARLKGSLDTYDELGRLSDNTDAIELDVAEWSTIEKAFGAGGIPQFEIDAFGPIISERADELLKVATEGRFSIRFQTSKATASGGRSEDMQILVYDARHDIERSIEAYSPGERALIDEAFRLSMTLYQLESTGGFGCIFRDEVSGNWGDLGCQHWITMLRHVLTIGPITQIFIVDHQAYRVLQRCDHIIEFEDGAIVNANKLKKAS